mgnify:FL=1|tara:strand:+ start:3526 stop:3900 length:375 start_codon:yes stop_codon:yes gene_type:complete
MENSSLKRRVLSEIESLITRSCPNRNVPQKFKNLHVAILKKYYNASDVSIDYHRKRVAMDIIIDDGLYDPKKVNMYIPTLHANLLFKNLNDFLKASLDNDHKSLAFYASLLRSYEHKDITLMAV